MSVTRRFFLRMLPAVGIVALVVLGIFFGPQAWTAISTAIPNRTEPATVAQNSAPSEPAPTTTPDPRILNPAGIGAKYGVPFQLYLLTKLCDI